MVAHFREWWLFGLFFAIVTPLQVAWAVLVLQRRAEDRRLLALGAAGNLAVAGVWAVSRVVGIPFGPEAFRAEAVGVKDVLATSDELMIAALVGILLLRAADRPAHWLLLPVTWTLVTVSVLGAMIAGH